ncbi:MAG: fatty acyl-AMP ligase [Bdellovibrionales bacterium]|nr:fatty acyl-AMP ligase [Bdellovibrionales bacterium]
MRERIDCSTLVDLVLSRSESRPGQNSHIFLRDGQSDEQIITYADLDQKARALAVTLSQFASPGDSVLINHNPGLEYVCSFFGCLYAGVVAIPVYPPRFNQKLERLDSIVREALPKVALTSGGILDNLSPHFEAHPLLRDLTWVDTEKVNADWRGWKRPDIGADSLAFLQYTSGSTSQPKGVMLSHGNLLSNLECISEAFEVHDGSSSFSWLPPYHDMGLIGGILEPIYAGIPVTMMSPYTFLMRPFRWLQALTKYKTTFSGAPNFAYELCTHRVTEKQMSELDLSHWELAYCGAEPIRADVLERFSQKFAAVGFKSEAFYPCYGLAESTLMVTGAHRRKAPVIGYFDRNQLETEGKGVHTEPGLGANALVSCGKTVLDHDVVIVNPRTFEACSEGTVGEIWVSGPSVALGYWKQPESTSRTFGVRLEGSDRRFLRTGDLGFLFDDELFVTGRIKDMVIIRGRNIFPQDVERAVELSHPSLKVGSGAVVSVEQGGEERLVVIQEVSRQALRDVDLDEVVESIKSRVVEEFGITPYAISLIKSNSIPLTSSGKVKRQASKLQFLQGELSEIKRSLETAEN